MTTAAAAPAPTAPGDSEEYLTVAETAEILRVSKMTIYTAIHSGELFAIRVGKNHLRIPKWAFRDYTSVGAATSAVARL